MTMSEGKETRVENWKLSRAGVINFWYYDEETFQFEDGRLLLRGSNGSGKSVTMQSLVPLLFDGNKSPERLDPFGSKARKMESYLLSDGLDLDERTGYLFLEFEKSISARTITVGMGMRARKNVPMQTWYFIVLDNRRIGASYDFTLYKDMGDKIPLTQKELENKIGQGGHVFTKQSDYKRAVNDHLFGYSELGDFDELITLLIQIRSPKLSKEFKPTTMYEIMQNSLVTLTDEDLRPMSEAIENMDEIKLRIDALETSKRSLNKIAGPYEKYNTFMLASKAKRFVKYAAEKKQNEDEKQRYQREQSKANQRLKEIEVALSGLEDEEETLRRQEASLKKHDLTQLAEERDALSSNIEMLEKSSSRKKSQIEKETEQERSLIEKIRVKQADIDEIEKAFKVHLEEMDEASEDAGFDEHAFFKNELNKDESGQNAFKYHKMAFDIYLAKVSEGVTALNAQDDASRRYDDALRLVEASAKEVERQTRLVLETEQQLGEIKAEFAEKTFKWAEKNHELKPPREVLQQVVERIYAYNAPYRFDQAIDPLYTAYEKIRENLESERLTAVGEKNQLKKTLLEHEIKYKEIEAQQEPEPLREDAVTKNRARLFEKGIPYLPLYKALDFSKNMDESMKDIIEEALEALGLLDALLISPKHREFVEAMDKGMADKYIFASPEYLSHNLSQMLVFDERENPFSKGEVEDVLMSILLNPTEGKLYIDEAGSYGMGIIRGKVSGTKASRFIGHSSRKRYKAMLLEEIRSEMSRLTDLLIITEEAIKKIESRKELLEAERKAFPGKEDLDLAYDEYRSASQVLVYKQNEEKRLRATSEEAYIILKDARLKVAEVTKGLYLTLTVSTFTEAFDALKVYGKALNALEHQFNAHKHALEMKQTFSEQLEDCLEQLDTLRYELEQNERERMRKKVRFDDIQSQLNLSDFIEIKREFERCQSRLRAIPSDRNTIFQERSDLNTLVRRLGEDMDRVDALKIIVDKMVHLYELAFTREYSLGYVLQAEINHNDVLEKAKEILKSYSAILDENRTILEYSDKLKERFIQESNDLAEYHLKMNFVFRELCDDMTSADDITHIERVDIVARVQGKPIKFHELSQWIDTQIMEQSSLLSEQDRMLFEEILINSISKKISGKIYHSEAWVKKIDELMNGMDTSSGLSFHLKWVTKEAEHEEQLSTKELVDLLRGDQALLTREQKDRLIRHFQSKIAQSKIKLADESDNRSFLAIMKEILDYRKWFQFQLYYTKKGEKRKELTNNAFFTFSGGEKAMAMYVPLFSAVYAKYSGARKDCPKVVSLDEAFAGVDERNITDMFRLLVKELDLGFVANSQVLYGDYETVPALSIYELIRPENATYVTTIRYKWNGHAREIVNSNAEMG